MKSGLAALVVLVAVLAGQGCGGNSDPVIPNMMPPAPRAAAAAPAPAAPAPAPAPTASAPPPAAPADISRIAGTYTFGTLLDGTSFTLGIDQSGLGVLLVFSAGQQFNGQGTVTFDGTTVRLSASATSTGCPGTFTVVATVDTSKNTMTGTISGSDCHITLSSFAFTATR